MASRVPSTVIHHGAIEGKVSAISQAVTSADPSVRNCLRGLPRRARITASAASAVAEVSAICTRIPAPKNQI
jgi:hypothetical protein